MRKINFKRAVLASMLSLSAFCVLGVSAAYAWVNTNDGIRDGDLVRFDIRNSDGTPALESLDVYIIKLVDEKRAYKRVIACFEHR